jgi:hypothetical protein
MIPVATVDRHALKAVAVMGAGLWAGAMVTAFLDLAQEFHLQVKSFLFAALAFQGHLANRHLVAVDFHVLLPPV